MRVDRSLVMAVLAVVGWGVCAAPTAAAPVGLDASYGSDGLVHLAPPLPSGLFPARYPSIEAVFAPDGSAYMAEHVSTCDSITALVHASQVSGSSDIAKAVPSTPGSAAPARSLSREGTELIAADAGGRVLVVTRSETGGKIKRLLPSGRPDKSFGRGGSVGLKGFKGEISFLAPTGRGRILVGVTEGLPEASETPAKRLTLFRLLPNGRLDRSFAKDGRGSYTLALPYFEHSGIVIDRRGSILILGSLCCEGFRPVYRISPKGKLDTGFDAAARVALQRLDAFTNVEPTALVPRPGGGVDVLGRTGNFYLNEKTAFGFELRLRANGSLDKRFGEHGAQSLLMPIAAASPGIAGGTIAVAQVEETVTVLRLLADGSPDPAFGGGSGIQVPQPGLGITPQPLTDARLGLFGNGFRICNQPTCINAPYLARFIEASPSQPPSKQGGGA